MRVESWGTLSFSVKLIKLAVRMYPPDLAFVHLCILLSVGFLFSDTYCTEIEPFSQAVSCRFWRPGWTEDRGFRNYFLLNERFDSLHLRTLLFKGHWGRPLAVISICSQKACHACFEPDLESLQMFFPKCLSRCYLRCFLFVRQVLLDVIGSTITDLYEDRAMHLTTPGFGKSSLYSWSFWWHALLPMSSYFSSFPIKQK